MTQSTHHTLAGEALAERRFEQPVLRFADAVLEHGRDRYGQTHSPLFVDGLHARSLERAIWEYGDQTWVLSNFASQQALMRLLDGLTALTGQEKYRAAAEETAAYMLQHAAAPNGLLYWGGHTAWDLETNRAVGEYQAREHEMKTHQPYYELMWRVNPQATARMLNAIWGGHILDWERLDYNRHAPLNRPVEPQWDHPFDQSLEIPFETPGRNLSFANIAISLIHAGSMLAALDEHEPALLWAERLTYRWQQGRHPETGLAGGQVSYRTNDRARLAYGHVHPQINEATMVATYHRSSRYHALPLSQMQIAEVLLERGGPFADTGQRYIEWALDDLKVYGQRVWDPQQRVFRSMITDGTELKWQEVTDRDGNYYATLTTVGPAEPDGLIFWSYAMAYRLGKDPAHWHMARELARALGFGELGEPDGRGRALATQSLDQALQRQTQSDDWRPLVHTLYALLELHESTGDGALLHAAKRVGDALLAHQAETGLFPRPGRDFARTGDEAPLALLHLAAALADKRDQMPRPASDTSFFHARYLGELAPHQQRLAERGDERTMDNLVYYGR